LAAEISIYHFYCIKNIGVSGALYEVFGVSLGNARVISRERGLNARAIEGGPQRDGSERSP
jgi:hypothetical protein